MEGKERGYVSLVYHVDLLLVLQQLDLLRNKGFTAVLEIDLYWSGWEKEWRNEEVLGHYIKFHHY